MMVLGRLRNAWINQTLFDYPLMLLVMGGVYLVGPLAGLRSEDHGSFYQTLATVSGVLLTLGTIVITLVFTVTPNERLDRVLRQVGMGLQSLVLRCLAGLVVTTVGFTGLFLLEDSTGARWRATATAALVAFAGLRFLRLWWILRRILEALAVRVPASTRDAALWQRPVVQPGDYRIPRRRRSGVKADEVEGSRPSWCQSR